MFLHRAINRINTYLPPTNPWLILFSSIPVALATGTLFVYSAYGTQIADRCRLDASTTVNLNIAATVGTAFGGLLSGIITDMYGTQIPILISSLTLSVGYFFLYVSYQLGEDSTVLSLLLAMFAIGLGSVSGYFGTLKAIALNFPNYKGSAQSVTIASFAISSLAYSYISSLLSTEAFLKFLSTSSALLTLIGFVFIRTKGLFDEEPEEEGGLVHDIRHEIEHIEHGSDVAHSNSNFDSQSTLLLQNNSNSDYTNGKGIQSPASEPEEVSDAYDLKSLSLGESLSHPIFWFHFIVFSITQGFGQMYIYSIGFILKAVHYYYLNNQDGDVNISLQKLQALHVSLIAVSSFLGRLSSGPASDFVSKSLKAQRHWILIIGSFVMLLGHSLQTLDLETKFVTLTSANLYLSALSCLIGFAYGFTFTCYPVIISDIFNLKYYSFIWGCLYTSTTLGLTLMSKIFGYIYDKNSEKWDDSNKLYICTKGSGCYELTFEITSLLSIIIIGALSGYVYIRAKSKK